MSDMGGSQQLRLFRRAMRDGATIEEAAERAGIGLGEARLHAADDAKNPPPEEAYELLPTRSTTEEEPTVATAAKKEADEPAGEYKKPDAARAFERYDKQIAPKKAVIQEKSGDLSEHYSFIKDECNFPRKILDLVIFLENQEDAKRDHMLLALSEGLKLRKLFMPRDLVTIASGETGADVVPTGDRPALQLVTLPMGVPSTGEETDLADAGAAVAAEGDPKDGSDGDDAAFEASAAELAKQEGRGKSRKKTPTIGEGFTPPLH